jgi:protein Mpv17
MFLGDVIAQYIERQQKLNWNRTLLMSSYTTTFTPLLHHWYKVLEWAFGSSTRVKHTLAKLACDQLFFAPLGLFAFFTITGLLEGQTSTQLKLKLQYDYPQALVANYCLWPAANFINFRYVPLQHRILYVSGVSLGWNVILSLIRNRKPLEALVLNSKQKSCSIAKI